MAASRLGLRFAFKPAFSIPSTPRTQIRPQAYRTTWQFQSRRNVGYRRPLNYQRFQQSKSLFQAWARSPYFYHQLGGIGALCGGFYIYNLEEVPVSSNPALPSSPKPMTFPDQLFTPLETTTVLTTNRSPTVAALTSSPKPMSANQAKNSTNRQCNSMARRSCLPPTLNIEWCSGYWIA